MTLQSVGGRKTVLLAVLVGMLAVVPLLWLKSAISTEAAGAAQPLSASITLPSAEVSLPPETPKLEDAFVETPPVEWPIAIASPEVCCLQSQTFVVHGRLAVSPKEALSLKAGELLYRADDAVQKAQIENLKIALQGKQAEVENILHSRIPYAKKQILYAQEARRLSAAGNAKRQTNAIRAMLVPFDEKIADAEATLANAQHALTQAELAIRKFQLDLARQYALVNGLSVFAPFAGTVVSLQHFENVVMKDGIPVRDEYHVVQFQHLEQLRLTGTITLAEFKRMKRLQTDDAFSVSGTLLETALDFRGKIESFSPNASAGVVKVSVVFDNPRLSSATWKERQYRVYPGELATARISAPNDFTISKR